MLIMDFFQLHTSGKKTNNNNNNNNNETETKGR